MTGRAREITKYGEPVLQRVCRPVTIFDAALRQLVEDMEASMAAADGVGLAANQIGVDARVFVYDCPDGFGGRVRGHLVNPQLTLPPAPREMIEDGEGCLSLPGHHAPLARAAAATVTGLDVDGRPVRVEGTGLLARCLQHEVDHLNGIVFLARLAPAERRALVRAFEAEQPDAAAGRSRRGRRRP